MIDNIQKMTYHFIGILKNLGLSKEETTAIVTLIEEKPLMMTKIVDLLEAKKFKLTPQETMNICGQTIGEMASK